MCVFSVIKNYCKSVSRLTVRHPTNTLSATCSKPTHTPTITILLLLLLLLLLNMNFDIYLLLSFIYFLFIRHELFFR